MDTCIHAACPFAIFINAYFHQIIVLLISEFLTNLMGRVGSLGELQADTFVCFPKIMFSKVWMELGNQKRCTIYLYIYINCYMH